MHFTLRRILTGLFLIISLALAGLTGSLAISSLRDYRTYAQIASLASLDKSLFEALVNLRAERGNSAIALILSKEKGAVSKGNVSAAREVIDTAMSRFTAGAGGIDDDLLAPALKRATDAFDQWKALRSRVDTNLVLELEQRTGGLNQEALDFGNVVLKTFDETSTLLESRIQTLDQGFTALIQMRAYAWSVRNNGGISAVMISAILSGNRGFTADERAGMLSNDAATKFAWQAVGGLVSHPSTPASLRTKYSTGNTAYFDGTFATKRNQLISELSSGPSKVFTVDEWQATSNSALGVVAEVASGAMAELNSTASSMKDTATRDSIIMSAGLLLAIALGIGGTMIIIRRVIGPVSDLTNCMVKLSEGNLEVLVHGSTRGDEIGEMARSVEIFREAAIRNKRLEEEAEANRARAELDRSDLQRMAEEDADRRLNQATASLAEGLKALSRGDMMCEITEPFAQQFESLRHDFNLSIQQLRATLSEFGRSVSTVNAGALEVSTASNELARRTEQQAASLEETAAALEEVTSNVKATSMRASDARETVRQAKTQADHSGVIVQDAMAAMERIEDSSKQIGQIIGVIDEIAFQTNLLALNAGVEAARAGDAGKGFAVVAQEVRELAQRSAKAAKEIKQLIAAAAAAVNEGVRLVDQTGTGLVDIEKLVRMANEHMEAVSTAAQEQSVGLTQINTAVNHLDQATQQNAAMVEEMNAAGVNLAQECVNLNNQLSQFSFSTDAEPLRDIAVKMRIQKPTWRARA